MKYRIIVSAIIEKEGSYLFGKKPKDIGPYPNTYHLLGGGIDPENESLLQGLEREVREEAGVTLTQITPLSFAEVDSVNKQGEDVHYFFHVFMTHFAGGELIPGDDIMQLIWVKKKDIATIPLPEPSQNVFKQLGWI